MTLRRLLRLLPIGLAVLVALNMAMMIVIDRQARTTFEQVRAAQAQRDMISGIRTQCEALTFKAVAWTLTRRTTQARMYEEGKKMCFSAVQTAGAAMPQAKAKLSALQEKLTALATLLETIQSEHTDETKMVTVGRLEREVQPMTAEMHQQLDALVRVADDESTRLMAEAQRQQQRTLWAGALVGIIAVVVGAILGSVVTRRILNSVG
ncbi:MAG TPA: hypothetical protein VLJ84_01010, partial [Usitatibacter sp.]|nr:hypothetical protein [Usitatibacter sp.]